MRRTALERELEYYRMVRRMEEEEPIARQIFRHIDIINQKAASVLTHLSIMVAISLGIFLFSFSRSGAGYVNIVIFLEIIGYIALTLSALAGALITDRRSFSGFEEEPLNRLVAIARFRRIALLVSVHGAYALTIALMVTLSMKLLSVLAS